MKISNRFSLVLTLLTVIVSMILVSFQVQKINVSGTWNMEVESSIGSGSPVFVFKQENDSIITGTYTGQFGEAPVKGKIIADKIKFQIITSDLTIDYSGIVEGTTMKGKVVFATYGDGTFTGNKKTE
jgi:hypothetical protein